ncbi:Ribonuclease Z [Balamuthia mandrillaris]
MKVAAPKKTNPDREWRTWKFPNHALTLTGYSRAADRTFFHVPEMKIGLDAGLLRGRQPEWVFLTHSHIDHAKDIPWVCKREGGMTLFCPEEVVPLAEAYLQAEEALNRCSERQPAGWRSEHRIVGVKPGDVLRFGKGDQYEARVVACDHAVPCVGYCFSERRTCLKEEYRGLPGKELARLRREGNELSEEYRKPLFVYMGDTSVAPYLRPENAFLFDYPVIITECTFLYGEASERLEERAERDGHIHWRSLKPIVREHPSVTFVLIHFSLRYRVVDVLRFFATEQEEEEQEDRKEDVDREDKGKQVVKESEENEERTETKAETSMEKQKRRQLDNIVVFVNHHSEGRTND